MITALKISDGHIFEKFCRILSNPRIGCHQGQIGVHGSCLLIIVAGSHLSNVLDLIPVPVCDQTDLGMHLISVKSIDNTAARLFQSFRPVDVILFIESGTQLDQHRDFFAIFRGRTKIFHQPRLLRQTVDCDLDRHDIRIGRCIFDQLQERIHAFVWIE